MLISDWSSDVCSSDLRRAGGLSLVDIVAVMIDGIEIGFAADMAPGGEEAAFVMLAARDRDAQAIERRAGGGRGAHRTGVAANPVDDEAIPITAGEIGRAHV